MGRVIEMRPVESSNVAAIGFEAPDVLRVKFKSGKTYEYLGVPADLFEQFANSGSFGSFFAKNIKGKYTGTVVAMDLSPGAQLGDHWLGEVAYVAYGNEVEWHTFSGSPMPQWSDAPERIREAWQAAGRAVRDVLQNPPA